MIDVLLGLVGLALFIGVGLLYYRWKDSKHVPSSRVDEEIARNWRRPEE